MPNGATTVAMVVCGIGSVVCSLIGGAIPEIADGPWLERGAFGLLVVMVLLWRKDARDREKGLSRVINAHQERMTELQERHEQHILRVLGENIEVMKRVAEALDAMPKSQKEK